MPFPLEQTGSAPESLAPGDPSMQSAAGAMVRSRPPAETGIARSSFPPAPDPASVGALVKGFRSRWLLATSAGIFCAAVGVAAVGALIRPTSTVRALLLLSPTTPKVIFTTADNIGEN